MPIRYTDNALTVLGSPLAIGATAMTVAAGQGTLYAVVDNVADVTDGQYVTLTRASDNAIEVIKIVVHDGAADLIATIVRDIQGVHGGVGLAFIAGDEVDARIPTELLDGLVQTDPNPGATTVESVIIVPNATALVNEDRGVTIGSRAENRGPQGDRSVVIGFQAKGTSGDDVGELGRQIVIGAEATNSQEESISIGFQVVGGGPRTIAIGNFFTRAGGTGAGNHGITIGHTSLISEDDCIWIGNDGDAGVSDGPGMIAIGHDHDLTPGSAKDNGIIIGKGFPGKTPGAESFVLTRPITMNTSGDTDAAGVSIGNSGAEIVVCTNVIDFKNGSPFELGANAFHEFSFGANGLFFVESLEMWVQVVFGPAITTPSAVKIGSTVGASDILAAHTFGTTFAFNTRERVSPVLLPDSGFNSVFIEVTQAAVGPTVFQGVYIIRGTLYGQ